LVDQVSRRRAGLRQLLGILCPDRGHQGTQLVAGAGLLHGIQVCLAGDDEARGHRELRRGQFAEVGALTSDERHIGQAYLGKPADGLVHVRLLSGRQR